MAVEGVLGGAAQNPSSRVVRPLRSAWRLAKRKPLGAASAVVLIGLVIVAAAAPVIAPYDPHATVGQASEAPSSAHLFGTDPNGRDFFSRIVFGARVSILTAGLAVGVGTAAGTAIGVVSGYAGGLVDLLTQRVMDVLMAIPGLVLVLLIVVVLGSAVLTAALAISVLLIPGAQRISRGSTLAIKESQYVDAARSLGAGGTRLVLRHVLPNIVAPILTVASITLGSAIIIEASLSFLGLGAPPPTPSWGGMLSGSGRQLMEEHPHLALFPILAISSVVLAFNLLGDAVRDVLDPKLRS